MVAVSSRNLLQTLVFALANPVDGSPLDHFCKHPLYNRRIGALVAEFLEALPFPLAIVSEFSQIVTRSASDLERLPQLSVSNREHFRVIENIVRQGVWYPFQYCEWLKKFKFDSRLSFLVDHGFSFTGYMPKSLFLPVKNPARLFGREVFHFVIKEGVLPSAALSALDSKVCLLDCGSSIDLALYKAILKLIGAAKFDRIFSANSIYRMSIGANEIVQNPIRRLMKFVRVNGIEGIECGDIVRVENVAQYSIKHPIGPGQGYNLLCNDSIDKTFLGFGLNPQGVTKLEVDQVLIDEFNKDPPAKDLWAPRVWETLARRDLSHFPSIHKIDRDQFLRLPSLPVLTQSFPLEHEKLDLMVLRPNHARIKRLIDAPLEKVLALFQSFPYLR